MAPPSPAVDHTSHHRVNGIDRLSIGNTILALGLGTGLSLLGDSTLYTVLPEPQVALQVGLTSGLVGIALGLNRLVRIGFNGLAGTLLDAISGRKVMLSAMAVGILANLCLALARGPWLFLTGRVLWGAAWSGIWVGAHATILEIAPAEQRGRLNGAYQAWFFGGAAATAFLGGVLVDQFGFRTTLWLSVASVTAGWLVWWRLLPRSVSTEKTTRAATLTQAAPQAAIWRASLKAAIPYFAARFTLAGVLASTTILWLGGLLDGTANGDWRSVLPLASLTGAFAAFRTLTSLGGAPAAGRLSDWLGRRWGVIGLSMAIGALGLWLMGKPQLVWALPGALMVAICGGATHALAPSLVGDRLPASRRSRGLGFVFSVGDLGSALGPPFALGALAAITIRDVYLMCAMLLIFVAAFAAWEDWRERQESGTSP